LEIQVFYVVAAYKLVKRYRRFGGQYCINAQGQSTLLTLTDPEDKQATASSETSVNAAFNVPYDFNIHQRR
jgi:hypothetical protein